VVKHGAMVGSDHADGEVGGDVGQVGRPLSQENSMWPGSPSGGGRSSTTRVMMMAKTASLNPVAR